MYNFPCTGNHSGTLTSIQALAYVNTTNTQLNLSHGAVAQALAKAAGPSLQAECTAAAPVQVGSVTVTKAGALHCDHILHVVAPNYDGPGGQAVKVSVCLCVLYSEVVLHCSTVF